MKKKNNSNKFRKLKTTKKCKKLSKLNKRKTKKGGNPNENIKWLPITEGFSKKEASYDNTLPREAQNWDKEEIDFFMELSQEEKNFFMILPQEEKNFLMILPQEQKKFYMKLTPTKRQFFRSLTQRKRIYFMEDGDPSKSNSSPIHLAQPEHTNSEYESPSREVQPNISQSHTQDAQPEPPNSERLEQRIQPVFDAIEILNKKEKIKEEEYYKLKQALEAVCRD
jgi:hypothetical protein